MRLSNTPPSLVAVHDFNPGFIAASHCVVVELDEGRQRLKSRHSMEVQGVVSVHGWVGFSLTNFQK